MRNRRKAWPKKEACLPSRRKAFAPEEARGKAKAAYCVQALASREFSRPALEAAGKGSAHACRPTFAQGRGKGPSACNGCNRKPQEKGGFPGGKVQQKPEPEGANVVSEGTELSEDSARFGGNACGRGRAPGPANARPGTAFRMKKGLKLAF